MSVVIYRGQVNNRVFTLTEKVPSTLVVGSYLFSFTSPNNAVKNFIAADISEYTEAYNEFNIEEVESGSESLLEGKVNLMPSGQWIYKIYAQTSTTNLDPDDADELVETGIVRVIGTDIEQYNEYDGQEKDYKYYTPE